MPRSADKEDRVREVLKNLLGGDIDKTEAVEKIRRIYK